MTRRKAAEVAEALHVDEDALLAVPNENLPISAKEATPEPTDRAPLGELAPNSAESKSQTEDQTQELRKSTRGKRAGKKVAARCKKNDLAASTTSTVFDDAQEVLPDENDSTPSPASEKAADELLKDVPECKSMHNFE